MLHVSRSLQEGHLLSKIVGGLCSFAWCARASWQILANRRRHVSGSAAFAPPPVQMLSSAHVSRARQGPPLHDHSACKAKKRSHTTCTCTGFLLNAGRLARPSSALAHGQSQKEKCCARAAPQGNALFRAPLDDHAKLSTQTAGRLFAQPPTSNCSHFGLRSPCFDVCRRMGTRHVLSCHTQPWPRARSARGSEGICAVADELCGIGVMAAG